MPLHSYKQYKRKKLRWNLWEAKMTWNHGPAPSSIIAFGPTRTAAHLALAAILPWTKDFTPDGKGN